MTIHKYYEKFMSQPNIEGYVELIAQYWKTGRMIGRNSIMGF